MAAVLSATTAMACGGGSPVANPVGPSLPNRSMSAVIDGVPWRANLMVGASGCGVINLLSITGYWSSTDAPFNTQMQTVGLTVNSCSVGTYTIADGSVNRMSVTDGPYPPDPTLSGQIWSASSVLGTGSGTVTITSSSASRITGTFSFVAPAQQGSSATGIKTITNGVFDVTWQ